MWIYDPTTGQAFNAENLVGMSILQAEPMRNQSAKYTIGVTSLDEPENTMGYYADYNTAVGVLEYIMSELEDMDGNLIRLPKVDDDGRLLQ